jgi:hypothetical protein
MLQKDKSLSRYPGWDAYVASTNLFFPRLLPPAAATATTTTTKAEETKTE